MPDILRIEQEAKDRGFDSAKFFISAPKGVFEAVWLDAYMGLFQIPSVEKGFIMVKDFPADSWEAFWDRSDAEIHNETTFTKLREFEAAMADLDDPAR